MSWRFRNVVDVHLKMTEVGLNQAELIRRSDVTPTVVRQRLKPGDTGGDFATLVKILKALGIQDKHLDWCEEFLPLRPEERGKQPEGDESEALQGGGEVRVNIPALEYGCLGRDAELKIICETMTQPSPKPVLLYGGPGIGKTTLKKRALIDPRMKAHFHERRYWVEADKANNADVLVRLIADAIGWPLLDPNPQSAQSALLTHLRAIDAPLVIGIDNIETPLGLAAQPEDANRPDQMVEDETKGLLRAIGNVPQVALLASFRSEAWVSAGTFWIGIPVTGLDESSAVELFLTVANLQQKPSQPDVLALMSQVEFVPAPIMLLAHHAEMDGSFVELQRRWNLERGSLMELGAGRDSSWKRVLSFSLESPHLKSNELALMLVRVMGRLPDGIKKSDISELLKVDANKANPVGDLLLKLGLIQNNSDFSRWRMLHPVREFIENNWHPNNDEWDIIVRHYLSKMIENGKYIGAPRKGSSALTEILPEISNIEYILRREFHRIKELHQMYWYYGVIIFFTNRGDISVFDGLLSYLQQSRDIQLKIFLSKFSDGIGELYKRKSLYDLAMYNFNLSLQVNREINNIYGISENLVGIGDIHRYFNRFNEAMDNYSESLRILTEVLNQSVDNIKRQICLYGIGYSKKGLGAVEYKKNNLQRAEQLFLEAYTEFGEIDSTLIMSVEIHKARYPEVQQANCLRELAAIYFRQNKMYEALDCFLRVRKIYLKSGDKRGIGYCYKGIADYHLINKNYLKAKRNYNKAFSIFESCNDDIGKYNCRECLALSQFGCEEIDLYALITELELIYNYHTSANNKSGISWIGYILFLLSNNDNYLNTSINIWNDYLNENQIIEKQRQIHQFIPRI